MSLPFTGFTPEQAHRINNAIAAASASYSYLNNGNGLKVGDALMQSEDRDGAAVGGKSLNLALDPGYVVQGVFKDNLTGLDAFVSYNAMTKDILITFAGTNVVAKDMPDSNADFPHTADPVQVSAFEGYYFQELAYDAN